MMNKRGATMSGANPPNSSREVEKKVEHSNKELAPLEAAASPTCRMNTMERLVQQFRLAAGASGTMSFQEFKRAVDLRTDMFAESIFRSIDTDNSGEITCDEYVNFFFALECKDLQGRLRVVFDLYDLDKTGSLNIAELTRILRESVEESNACMDIELIATLAEAILDAFDADGNGEISFDEFVKAMSRYPELLAGLTLGNFRTCAKKRKTTWQWLKTQYCQIYLTVVNNPQRVFWMLVLFVILASMFWWRASRYIEGAKSELMGWTLPVAKGCGQMIKAIVALILLPISRSTMTRLGQTRLRHIFPFDDAVDLHKILGTLGFIFAWIHSLCHVHDFLRWGDPSMSKVFKKAFPNEPKQPTQMELWTSLVAVTGVLQLVIFTLVFLTASNWPRRTPWMLKTRIGKYLNNFNLIWYVHHLTGLFILLLIFHPMPHIPDEANEWGYSDTWAWIGVPVLIYCLERLARVYRQTKQVRILSAELLPGRVLGLKLSKPKNFNYKPGMYVYINCPSVAQFEWHPFSLTSAPGADHISLHIRVAGDWTEELYTKFQEYEYISLRESQAPIPESVLKYCTGLKKAEEGLVGRQAPRGGGPCKRSSTVPPCAMAVLPGPGKSAFSVETDVEMGGGEWGCPVSMMGSSSKSLRRSKRSKSMRSGASMGGCSMQREWSMPLSGPVSIADIISDITQTQVHLQRQPSGDLQGRLDMALANMTQSHSIALSDSNDPSHCGSSPKSGAKLDSIDLDSKRAQLASQHSFSINLAHIKGEDKRPSGMVYADVPLTLKLDGPFGAPVQSFKDYSAILLIGAGIGVTPFASVLCDLLQKVRKAESGGQVPGMRRLKKVYFHWSVRSQAEVMWFSRVLEAISRDDLHNLLDIHVHITGLRQSNDVRTMLLKFLQITVHSETGVDVVSGLESKVVTHFGRPNWDTVFNNIQRTHPKETIGVLYSGPNSFARVLGNLSQKYTTKTTKFRFRKEQFGYW